MSKANSTAPAKPNKPFPDFPLFPHATGRWAKKIWGKLHYFGKWDDPEGALQNYLDKKEALFARRTPRPDPEALTVKALANAFLNAKQAQLDAGELSPRTWKGYKETTDFLVARFGKQRLVSDLRPDDFAKLRSKMAEQWGLYRLATTIQCTRSVFKYGFDAELMATPMRFGPGFNRPSKKTFRLERARQGVKLFTAEEIRRLLGAAGTTMRAMILLGINCAFGPSDLANLPTAALELEGGWIDYPRPKTGIRRRCWLWPETVDALKESLAHRPAPKDDENAKLFFITKYGGSWGKDTSDTPVSKETSKLLKALHINGREGLGHYTLRHTFRTVADEAKDQPAADFIMGHESPHMSSVYRETISAERLVAVAEHVRAWLWAKPKKRQRP